MATASNPAAGNTPAPPNFYEQAAQAPQGAPAKQDFTQANTEFQNAVTKLLSIFDKLEKMKPNGMDISKNIKAMAQTLKDTQSMVFEGSETEEAIGTGQPTPGTTGAATGAPPSGTPGTPPAGA